MSLDDSGGERRQRRALFRRRTNDGIQHFQQSNSNDDLDSLGMGSSSAIGKGDVKPTRAGIFGRRKSSDHAEVSHERPKVITTGERMRSADELSLEESSFPDDSNQKQRRAPKHVWQRLNPLAKKTRRSRGKDVGSDADSDRSPLQTDSLQHLDSFESDNMYNLVRKVDPGTRFQRRNRRAEQARRVDPMLADGGLTIHTTHTDPGTRNQRRNRKTEQTCRIDPVLADGGLTIHTNQNNNDSESEAPIKRITFNDSVTSVDQDMAPPTRFNGFTTTVASLSSIHSYIGMATNIATNSFQYPVQDGPRSNRKKVRVRPYHCFNDAVHMTEEELYTDSTKPSVHYEHLKSYLAPSSSSHKKRHIPDEILHSFGSPSEDGRIGSLRCEVLGCVSLARHSKPDICVYLIAGDAAFCTDVIPGFRSPMWPSLSRRAAVFPLHHAYTRLYAGVFDVRARKNKENDVFCGRIAIDIATLRPNTDYDITFPLRASAFVYDKQKRGVLRLRFCLHWFSERGAVLSYFSTPQSLDTSAPRGSGSLSIPCADPKTFRNVAVTVHGSDLPGKYSRTAFKATVREFQLYQLNLRFMLKYLVIDAVMYEKPYLSLYLFFAGMHCVITESVCKVPPYIMGFVIVLYLESYKSHVADRLYNEGYQSLTLWEIFKALVSNPWSKEKYFQPIRIAKRAKKRAIRANQRTNRRILADSPAPCTANDDGENALLDHKEFPFSDREAYPKFTVDQALAPSTRGGSLSIGVTSAPVSTTSLLFLAILLTGNNVRLNGRLSVYYAPVNTGDGAGNNDSGDEDDDESSCDSIGEETIIEGAGIYDEAFDLDDEDDTPMDSPTTGNASYSQQGMGENIYGYGSADRGSSAQGESGKIRRIIHSAQNIDDSGGVPIPPQVTVKRVENLLHKNSFSIAVEKVAAPPTIEHVQLALHSTSSDKLALTTEEIEKEIEKMRKAYLDEFDKLLGLQSKSSNPISRMFATFLGPLMRMLRIPVFIFRISFNAYTWRDPFLSFWVFFFMCLTLIILMAFPWRLFFFLVIVVGLGPQNIFLRKYLEKRAAQAEQEKKEKQESDTASIEMAQSSKLEENDGSTGTKKQKNDDIDSCSVKIERRGLFGRKKNRGKVQGAGDASEFLVTEHRPPFSSDVHGTSHRKLQPRSVVVPYSKLRKERIYDWPPDPTVSRATPLEFGMCSFESDSQDVAMNEAKNESQQVERRLSAGNTTTPCKMAVCNSTLRRRGSL